MSSRSSVKVALGATKRQILRMLKSPPLLLPVMMFAPILLAAFAGGLSAIGKAPGFDYYDYTAFIFVYVVLQGAASSGAVTGIAVAGDFEGGFARRMLLGTRTRWPLIASYVLANWFRLGLIIITVSACAFAGGMDVSGNVLQFFGFIGLAFLINTAATLFAIGVALRVRSVQAGPMMQLPILLTTFLAPVYATRELMTGWVAAVADVNPLTALFEAGRSLLAGRPEDVALAFGICAALIVIFTIYAGLGMRKATSG